MIVNYYFCEYCNVKIYFPIFDAFNTKKLTFKCFACKKDIIIKKKEFKKLKQIFIDEL